MYYSAPPKECTWAADVEQCLQYMGVAPAAAAPAPTAAAATAAAPAAAAGRSDPSSAARAILCTLAC